MLLLMKDKYIDEIEQNIHELNLRIDKQKEKLEYLVAKKRQTKWQAYDHGTLDHEVQTIHVDKWVTSVSPGKFKRKVK